jgi:hypothetical protein
MHTTAVLGQVCGVAGSMSAGIYGQRGFEVNKNVMFVEELVAYCVWHLLHKSGIGPFSATEPPGLTSSRSHQQALLSSAASTRPSPRHCTRDARAQGRVEVFTKQEAHEREHGRV